MAADFSFRIKLFAALFLTVLADIFFYRQSPGATFGLFALCLLAVLAFVHR
ncbi:MAG: hypothetical protein JWM33_187, partial [Caulobacteraceae bacterium]|nr:hypothetical protein [Caulobacteraceae bacterium]